MIYTNTYLSLFEYNIAMETLSQSNISIVTVPLTVRMALCKLATSAAQGKAKEEIQRTFYLPSRRSTCYDEVSKITNMLQVFSVTLINKMYVNDSRDLNSSFVDNSARRFGVHVQKMLFSRSSSARAYINHWFELVSLRRLKDVLSLQEVNASTSILHLSAVHIKTTWDAFAQFNIFHTKNMEFRRLDGSLVKVPMMKIAGEFMYYHDNKYRFQLVNLPLTSYGMSMTFILSDHKSNIRNMVQGLCWNPGVLQEARHKMKYTVLTILLPRLKIKSSFTWDPALKKAGVKKIFEPGDSGLDSLLRSKRDINTMFLSKVKQKVVIDMDETGVLRSNVPNKRTGSDEFLKQYPILRKTKKEFRADHPFFFSVDMQVSSKGDQTLFAMGVYYGPESNS